MVAGLFFDFVFFCRGGLLMFKLSITLNIWTYPNADFGGSVFWGKKILRTATM